MCNRSAFIWPVVFALGAAAGVFACDEVLPHAVPVLKLGLGAAERLNGTGGPTTALFIFSKNILVVLLCVLLGGITRGIYPAFICLINGCVVGLVGAVLSEYGGIAWWKYVIALLPHGIIELAAVFLGCAIGAAALTMKEKLVLLKYPIAMLAVAACVETWISTAIANRII